MFFFFNIFSSLSLVFKELVSHLLFHLSTLSSLDLSVLSCLVRLYPPVLPSPFLNTYLSIPKLIDHTLHSPIPSGNDSFFSLLASMHSIA